jgi:drug/metabolite transporter (DMT)-like permease
MPATVTPARRARGPLFVASCTAAALVGFAANSLLSRAALGAGEIDATTFTGVRLGSGALMLAVLVRARGGLAGAAGGSWLGAAALFAYAYPFSLAYLRIGASTGALVLFGSVQATMIGAGWARGERPRAAEWLGLAVAAGGLLWLTFPGLAAPDPAGAALMGVAGAAWGLYSLLGRRSGDPLRATADNFARSVVFALALAAATCTGVAATPRGVWLAVASGALASGLGYTLWYAALPRLTAMRAATVQLCVPALTAAAAVVLLGEPFTPRLALAATLILGGVLLATAARARGGVAARR